MVLMQSFKRSGEHRAFRRAGRLACWGLLLTLGAMPLSAQSSRFLGPLGQALTPIEGNKHYEPNILTIEQLTRCVALRRDVPELETQLESLQLRVSNSAKTLDNLILQLEQLKPYLEANKDRSFDDEAQVKAFNLQVDKFNGLNRKYRKQIEKYQVLEGAYNGLVNEHDMLLSIHQDSCEARQYYREDMLTVLAALGEAKLSESAR